MFTGCSSVLCGVYITMECSNILPSKPECWTKSTALWISSGEHDLVVLAYIVLSELHPRWIQESICAIPTKQKSIAVQFPATWSSVRAPQEDTPFLLWSSAKAQWSNSGALSHGFGGM
jgi:hypothetical protein